MIDKQRLEAKCSTWNIALTGTQLDQLDAFAQILVDYNQKVNLTAITDPEGIEDKHFLDSLLFASQPEVAGRMVDVGAGAGFPSMPVKIARPDLAVTMLDSLQKRLTFLEEVSRQLELDRTFIHARAEDGGREKKLRERFDFATARAVAHLRELAEYCLPYVKVGGYFVALKGPGAQEEIAESKNAIATMGGKVEKVMQFCLPENSTRTIVVIRKISQTPTSFPRTAAKMAKKPIL